MDQWKRKRATVDFRFQGRTCLRVTAYWAFCAAVIAFLTVGRESLAGPDNTVESSFVIRAAFASLLVLPLAWLDCLIFTNRFAGPLRRLSVALKQLADGNAVTPIALRDGDEYQDLVSNLNRVSEELQSLRDAAAYTESVETVGS